MSNNSPLTKRLYQARTHKGISQRKLGILLGMEPNTASARMNQYETGKHTPDYKTLKRMADELSVPVAFFFCESEVTADLVCQISKLSKKKQKELLAQLEGNE